MPDFASSEDRFSNMIAFTYINMYIQRHNKWRIWLIAKQDINVIQLWYKKNLSQHIYIYNYGFAYVRLSHLCRPLRSTFAVREIASFGQQMFNAPVGINGLQDNKASVFISAAK